MKNNVNTLKIRNFLKLKPTFCDFYLMALKLCRYNSYDIMKKKTDIKLKKYEINFLKKAGVNLNKIIPADAFIFMRIVLDRHILWKAQHKTLNKENIDSKKIKAKKQYRSKGKFINGK